MSEAFDAAVQALRVVSDAGQKSGQTVSNDILLKFYGLYKQATAGDCNTKAPSLLDPVKRAKWTAWQSYKGTSSKEAQVQYVSLALDTIGALDLNSFPEDGKVAVRSFVETATRNRESKEETKDEVENDNAAGNEVTVLSPKRFEYADKVSELQRIQVENRKSNTSMMMVVV